MCHHFQIRSFATVCIRDRCCQWRTEILIIMIIMIIIIIIIGLIIIIIIIIMI